MRLRTQLLLYLLVSVTPSNASLFARGPERLLRGVSSAHRRAVERSAALAKDLRRALSGVLVEQAVSDTAVQHVYCISGTSLTGNGSSSSDGSDSGGGSGSSPAKGSGTATASGSSPSSTSTSSSPWKLKQAYQGNSFFDGWSFFTASDPTDGTVEYVGQSTAASNNLTSINSAGHAIMRVDTTPKVSGNRMSVRITTNYNYTGALVVLDAVHMPTGCGTWPAFWSNGPNWPAGGEIDIVEGVNTYTNNQATIHTNPGCTIPSNSSSVLDITGTVVGPTNCAAAQTDNQGCGIRSNSNISYGPGFNQIGGGVYAMQWDDNGVSVWFFPRSDIPSDITDGSPDSSGWGTPMANWPATGCNPSTYFYQHSAIFDTTLCGQWAGNVWSDTGAPGQSESCASITGTSSCSEYVQNNGAAFADAYWEVGSVKIYQTS
ncbi:glycoside hydrolase family 16 protein [Wolfiporia cocos MD-104 SS10]|uniref:Glycoside hydrolase family 16 protein n=1 Tax=Wolfiporia cocos (strain MD-104) TaxID=742152 RepID=A0A2H3IT89_WOLCO|nr:glycoside hydrolase family 16 protein [Wolfiporia cocos MD-104 SS10]